jgi:two-component system phosphate regulon sensor histidine kinase PhoR
MRSSGVRSRAAALALVWLVVAAGVGVSLGLPAWVAAPMALVAGVLATVAILRALDQTRDVRAAEELAILVRARDLLAPESAGAPGPESVEALASAVGMERSRQADRADRFEAIINAIDAPTIAVDAAGRIFHSNGPANELFGGPLAGRMIEEAFTQPDLVALPIAARRGAARRARVRVARPTGAILLDVAVAPFGRASRVAEDGEARPARHGVVMTMRDVTELAAAAQLKTDFVANASHELRTPLASIRAAVETIQDHGANDPETRDRFLRTIAKAASRLEDLCRDLLDLSRVETTEPVVELRSVSLTDLCEEIADLFAPTCQERRLSISVEIDPRVATVSTDVRLLHVILKNLVENAVKFAFEGTTVRVVAAPGSSEDARPGYASLRLEVSDKGIGIPISLQARIFERFFQADPSRAGNTRGTGLGLAIVKHAVRSLGGRVTVDSVWKQGTTMRVELPDAVVSPHRT